MQVLLIEDNHTIASQLIDFLEGHGWQLDFAARGLSGIRLAAENIYDVVILDLNLPDIDGLQVCESIKSEAKTNTPVLMLTARDSFEDKASGFNQGADDYITKPFDLRELVLRCKALARRNQLHLEHRVEIGDLVIETRQQQAFRSGTELELSNIGFTILVQLANAFPMPVSRSVLIQKIWGDDPPDSDSLRSHIYSLRHTLDKPFAYPMLVTITNVGFKLQVE